jgi:hypothetical protein
MTEENPLLPLTPTDKIEPTNIFGRKFSAGLNLELTGLTLV